MILPNLFIMHEWKSYWIKKAKAITCSLILLQMNIVIFLEWRHLFYVRHWMFEDWLYCKIPKNWIFLFIKRACMLCLSGQWHNITFWYGHRPLNISVNYLSLLYMMFAFLNKKLHILILCNIVLWRLFPMTFDCFFFQIRSYFFCIYKILIFLAKWHICAFIFQISAS